MREDCEENSKNIFKKHGDNERSLCFYAIMILQIDLQ